MAEAFWCGLLIAHLGYGATFFLIAARIKKPPTIVVSMIAIVFWPVIVHYIITRGNIPSPRQEEP